MESLKKLPLGHQTFSKIIDGNFFYADKTKFVYELATSGERGFFLSRPRRFGKTLLLSTIEELFSGDRKRFQGLWISGSDYAFPKRPVLAMSLATGSRGPKRFEIVLLDRLKAAAQKLNLKIGSVAPDLYFAEIIKSLSAAHGGAEVVVLVDECDAPVAKNVDNLSLASDNAAALRDFLAVLHDANVQPLIRFTLLAGLAGHALTPLESGANRLHDISLDPQYAGICGFTVDEFDHLFGDRLKPTLSSLKAAGLTSSSSSPEDLKREIFEWYDGYNWGGETRVLNPWSILRFFKTREFGHYWMRGDRPRHLTSLLKARPWDFLVPKLDSRLQGSIKKAEPSVLEAAPVLFHSGYLTLDKNSVVGKVELNSEKEELSKTHSFRFPNFEVESAYYDDCVKVVFDLKNMDDLKKDGQLLQYALLNKEPEKASELFKGLFLPLIRRQRPSDEKTFNSFVQLLLSNMGFKAFAELPGAADRSALILELSNRVYLLLALKHVAKRVKISKNEEVRLLAAKFASNPDRKEKNRWLAEKALEILDPDVFDQIKNPTSRKAPSEDEIAAVLAKFLVEMLPKDVFNQVKALLARRIFSAAEIEDYLNYATSSDLSGEKIDQALSKAAKQALLDMSRQNCHGLLRDKADVIIDLGLAVYGYGVSVKAIFGPLKD
ncbi:MAG: AAA family ATPase [Deltaproteobacteria bacterium]|nr:AAA family ATPase [Deltaproteobacteria bacterium]